MPSLARLVATVGVEVEEGGTKRGKESGGDEPEEQEGGGCGRSAGRQAGGGEKRERKGGEDHPAHQRTR